MVNCRTSNYIVISQYTAIDVDYTIHQMFELTFQEGSKPGIHKNITIAILPDAVVEDQESFLILLTSLSSLAEIKEGRNSTSAVIQDTTSKLVILA